MDGLPEELWLEISKHLTAAELLRLSLVNTAFQTFTKTRKWWFWRDRFIQELAFTRKDVLYLDVFLAHVGPKAYRAFYSAFHRKLSTFAEEMMDTFLCPRYNIGASRTLRKHDILEETRRSISEHLHKSEPAAVIVDNKVTRFLVQHPEKRKELGFQRDIEALYPGKSRFDATVERVEMIEKVKGGATQEELGIFWYRWYRWYKDFGGVDIAQSFETLDLQMPDLVRILIAVNIDFEIDYDDGGRDEIEVQSTDFLYPMVYILLYPLTPPIQDGEYPEHYAFIDYFDIEEAQYDTESEEEGIFS